MFSNKENINILTSLLVAHGVKRVVVCPGSRNAPIVHNLNECKDICCYSVTDERSAGFYALGMSLADDLPVAVCVTSGTALLNLAPAVAEASYRHHGLIVISADRPSAWIEQLDGQTLPQPHALDAFVGKSVTLPEPHDDIEHWYCNRLVNEALLSVKVNGCRSVHINVPISEPLFEFEVAELPCERVIRRLSAGHYAYNWGGLVKERLSIAAKPMLVIGQINRNSAVIERALSVIEQRIVILSEPLSSGNQRLFDLVLAGIGDEVGYLPDFVIYVGDTLVSKRVKHFLRKNECIESWLVSEDGEVHDTFMNLSGLIECDPETFICQLADEVSASGLPDGAIRQFLELWHTRMNAVAGFVSDYEPRYSQLAAIKEFELSLEDMDYGWHVHYANSNSVRLSCIYSWHYVWCNRGVNGIEGSLSTAAGFSVATDDIVFCIIGDLSFFYDQNALWNINLKGNLRILLLNNQCGGIFYSLRGIVESPAFGKYVSARHHTTAQGICTQNDVGYLSAHNMDELRYGLVALMTADTARPMLLEVFTDAEEDKRVIRELMNGIKNL